MQDARIISPYLASMALSPLYHTIMVPDPYHNISYPYRHVTQIIVQCIISVSVQYPIYITIYHIRTGMVPDLLSQHISTVQIKYSTVNKLQIML